MASEEKNSSKLNFLNKILYGAIVIFIILVITYFIFIFNLSDEQKGNWGTFGDFIGGTLNPIFALFSLFAIIYTIKIQTKELELSREELEATRKELEGSRIAQQEQSESLKLQNQATKLQMFENTFFKLFDLFNLTKNTLQVKMILVTSGSTNELGIIVNDKKYELSSNDTKYWEKYQGNSSRNRAIELFLDIFKILHNRNYNDFNRNYESLTGAYFGQVYQLLKFVDESIIDNKKRYISIFRAQFTKEELELLFYHCLGDIGRPKFKLLVEKYEFFEHMIHHKDIDKPLKQYDIKAFGKSQILINKYNGIS
ncbi:putative phage abortive infection protein [Aliarcobacter butzleri]|uniref:putative phage abortive infection protein n=1 Tax=Aliarcobacter butzleri TaxID=28197 RepID=UPI002B24730D|nr:putative phage abortive infection protein [Aliarcobacter butzleri]